MQTFSQRKRGCRRGIITIGSSLLITIFSRQLGYKINIWSIDLLYFVDEGLQEYVKINILFYLFNLTVNNKCEWHLLCYWYSTFYDSWVIKSTFGVQIYYLC